MRALVVAIATTSAASRRRAPRTRDVPPGRCPATCQSPRKAHVPGVSWRPQPARVATRRPGRARPRPQGPGPFAVPGREATEPSCRPRPQGSDPRRWLDIQGAEVGGRDHELADDQVRAEFGDAVADPVDPDLDHRGAAAGVEGAGVGDDLVAEAAGAEDVQLQLDRGEVEAGRDRAEGGPGGDGVAEGGPDAAVDEAAGVQVAALDDDPAAGVVVLDLQRLDAEIGGKLPTANSRMSSGLTWERSAMARYVNKK